MEGEHRRARRARRARPARSSGLDAAGSARRGSRCTVPASAVSMVQPPPRSARWRFMRSLRRMPDGMCGKVRTGQALLSDHSARQPGGGVTVRAARNRAAPRSGRSAGRGRAAPGRARPAGAAPGRRARRGSRWCRRRSGGACGRRARPGCRAAAARRARRCCRSIATRGMAGAELAPTRAAARRAIGTAWRPGVARHRRSHSGASACSSASVSSTAIKRRP